MPNRRLQLPTKAILTKHRIFITEHTLLLLFISASVTIYYVLTWYQVTSNIEWLYPLIALNILWILTYLAVSHILTLRSEEHFSRKDKSDIPTAIKIILLGALLTRLLCFSIDPILEDDHYRYLWDGFLVSNWINPYLHPPSDFFSFTLSESESAVLDQVSYPSIATIYGPLAEYFFALNYVLADTAIWPIKLMILMSETLIFILLIRQKRYLGFVLYSCCPMIIHSFAINIHIDIIAITFLILACLLQTPSSRRLSTLASNILLGCAIAIKPFAIFAIPWFLYVQRRLNLGDILNYKTCFREAIIPLLIIAATYACLALPFWLNQGSALINIFQISEQWAFNNPIYYLTRFFLGDPISRTLLITSFILAVLFLRVYFVNIMHIGPVLFGVMLLLSPVVNAWYLAWVLLFASFNRFQLWPWLAAVCIWLSYASGINLSNQSLDLYQIPSILLWLEWTPVLVIVLISLKQYFLATKRACC